MGRGCGTEGEIDTYAELRRADGRGDAARDAAAVLLVALQLGFQGRYRGAGGQRHLQAYGTSCSGAPAMAARQEWQIASL